MSSHGRPIVGEGDVQEMLTAYRDAIQFVTVKHAARNIYNGYLGWFQADPWALDPLPYVDCADISSFLAQYFINYNLNAVRPDTVPSANTEWRFQLSFLFPK